MNHIPLYRTLYTLPRVPHPLGHVSVIYLWVNLQITPQCIHKDFIRPSIGTDRKMIAPNLFLSESFFMHHIPATSYMLDSVPICTEYFVISARYFHYFAPEIRQCLHAFVYVLFLSVAS